MRRPRISILALIAGVVACGVAFAALRTGSDYWLSAFYTMTVGLLLGAVIAARYRRGRGRAFWFGFAVFGWGLFLLGSNVWIPQIDFLAQGSGANLNRNLLTTRLILFLVVRIRMGTDDLQQIDNITANTVGIVHLMVVLSGGIGGGLFAAWMKRRGRSGATPDGSGRPHAVPSLIILVALSLAGLGTLDRPRLFPIDPETLLNEEIFRWQIDWLSKALDATGQPSMELLARRDRQAIGVRFLWLPSFDHPVCVWVGKGGNGARLHAVVLDGLGGYDPGRVAIARTVELNEDQWRGIERRLEATSFWKMPTKISEDTGTDGDVRIVEAVRGGRYHMVDRREPEPAFADLCRSMLELSGLKTRQAWESNHRSGPTP